MRGSALSVVLALLVAACASRGGSAVSGVPGSAAAGADSSAGVASAVAEQPIANSGPGSWDRGPYDLTGGNYRLDWESDGTCTALYFGIVGVTNGFKESPPTVGDVALKDMTRGGRTIPGVPAGSYYFNVSNVACKSYSATLTRVP